MNELRPTLDALRAYEEEDARTHGERAVAAIVGSADAALAASVLDQRHLDEAMADAVEVVRRHRTRLGRRVCSPHDGQTIRQIFGLLRGMLAESSADSDQSWGNG